MTTKKNITIISILLLILLIAIGIVIALGSVRKHDGSGLLGLGLGRNAVVLNSVALNTVALDEHLVPEAKTLDASLQLDQQLEALSSSATWGTVSQNLLSGRVLHQGVRLELVSGKLEALRLNA